ncbi:MAG: TonB family protein [Muribaculaceae bacterium]|nr:TonB family protein [Muribaculaceae bacterium]
MKHGKHICNTLKAIRLDIARANGIEYAPRECHHEGDCAGTCPACESEMRYLEREIARRRNLGRAALVAGVSMSLSSLSAMAAQAPSSESMMSSDNPANQLSDTTKVYQVVGQISESVPQFPGGDAALIRYFHDNFKYPPELAETCFQGRVVVSFLVDKTGQVAEVKVLRSVDELLDREVVRVCESLPRFTPARNGGEAVDFWYTLPISIKGSVSFTDATQADALTRINGTVLDEHHEPLVGAMIALLSNPKKGVATDIDGHFKLDVPKDSKIKVTYIGYEDAIVTASDGMTITLKPSGNILQGEVCVVVKSRAKNAQYPGGDKALQKFIKKNFVFPTEFSGQEYVMIEVDVDEKGNVSNPQVLNNELCTAFEQEALRVAGLIKKIKPARDTKGKKTDSTFSIVFDSTLWTK